MLKHVHSISSTCAVIAEFAVRQSKFRGVKSRYRRVSYEARQERVETDPEISTIRFKDLL